MNPLILIKSLLLSWELRKWTLPRKDQLAPTFFILKNTEMSSFIAFSQKFRSTNVCPKIPCFLDQVSLKKGFFLQSRALSPQKRTIFPQFWAFSRCFTESYDTQLWYWGIPWGALWGYTCSFWSSGNSKTWAPLRSKGAHIYVCIYIHAHDIYAVKLNEVHISGVPEAEMEAQLKLTLNPPPCFYQLLHVAFESR